ncbi:precorrin-3B synthase [Geodermatophilus sabuli]|uniref:Precorrin-3B synthase n=1 Tax=Geodermatophilus sabuli TaxID=1564158 RepID=A0A285ECV0_9ACTN|nr:precorrin-3B synthase [Geodermatophilus sabuli]MBB3083460.1 precorrin-3B synthase [Geodermatophilus sabuli]SNX96820.1 precorrin-3B synthase [Geodermatophilus sabuli]
MTVSPAVRLREDACPGALQTHAAADGALARVRVPGGLLTAAQLRVLADAARDLGDSALELTSRGNVQLRGLAGGAERDLGTRLAAAGLLPSPTHERVRNVLASTLTGRAGGHVDIRPWVAALDAGLCADPAAAALPGRYLATLDDGRGDVAGLGGDVGLLALGPDDVALTLAGADSGLRARTADAVVLALAATLAFLDERAAQGGTAWRLAELDDGPERVVARLRAAREDVVPADGRVPVPPARATGPVGAEAQADGCTALVAVVPLGRLRAEQADLLAGLAGEVQLTPWRSVVVPDLAEDRVDDAAVDLYRSGMVFDADSPWTRVTACAGRPGCAKSLADVRADAAAAVAGGTLPAGGERQHWAGCARRCGRPRGEVVDVVATGTGYRIGKA